MPPVPRFQTELQTAPNRAFAAKCFRVVELEAYVKAGTPSLLFDLGPKISKDGQRFSPPGDHRGLYVSTELLTAGSEFADGKTAWREGGCAKHVTFDIDVKLDSVLDLTDAATRRCIKTSKSEVQSAWLGYTSLNGGAWPPTWSLGHEAFASGRYDGILFRSTKIKTGTCLLIFTERLAIGKTHLSIQKTDGSEWERLP
jgi:hypothetical protein